MPRGRRAMPWCARCCSKSGLRLVVGRDVVERRGFTAIVLQGFFYRRGRHPACSRCWRAS